MNGRALDLLTSAAIFRGELGRMLLAMVILAGIALLSLAVLWVIEEWKRVRKSPIEIDWFVYLFLGLLICGELALLAMGLK